MIWLFVVIIGLIIVFFLIRKRSSKHVFKDLKDTIKSRFILEAPIFLIVGEERFTFGSEIIAGNNWFVNNEAAFIFTSYKEVEVNVQNLFLELGPRCFHSLVFFVNGEKDIGIVKNTIELINRITKIDCWTFFLVEEDFGMLKKGLWLFESWEKMFNDVIRSFALGPINDKAPKILENLKNYYWLEELVGKKQTFLFYDKKDNQIVFLDDFWTKVCYNKASEAQFTVKEIEGKIAYVGQNLLAMLIIIIMFVSSYKLVAQYYEGGTLAFAEQTTVNLGKQLKFLKSNFQLNLFSNNNVWQKKLIDKLKEKTFILTNRTFSNPLNSEEYRNAKARTLEILNMKSLLENLSTNKDNLFFDKVLEIWDEFFNKMSNYEPLVTSNQIDNLMSEITTSRNLYGKAVELKNLIQYLKIQLNNQFWLFQDWKEWKIFADSLGPQISSILRAKQLEFINNTILSLRNYRLPRLGAIFNVKEQSIELTESYNLFAEQLEEIIAANKIRETINIETQDFYFFDLEALQNCVDIWKRCSNLVIKNSFLLDLNKRMSAETMESQIAKTITANGNKDLYFINKNTYNGFSNLFPILIEMKKCGHDDFFNKIISFFQTNLSFIGDSVKTEVDDLFSFIEKVNNWPQEKALGDFLFATDPYNFIEKLNNKLFEINLFVLKPFLEITNSYPFFVIKEMDFIKYMNNQITGLSNASNDLFSWTNFVKNINNVEFQWQPEYINSKNENYIKHKESYLKLLITRKINNFLLNKAKDNFNKLVESFNQKLSNKFPFGTAGRVIISDLKDFIDLYKSLKNTILCHKDFMNRENVKQTMEQWEIISNFFQWENNGIKFNVYGHCHFQDGTHEMTNCNLIKKYSFTFGNAVNTKDNFECKIDATDSTVLRITLGQDNFTIDKTYKFFENDFFSSIVINDFDFTVTFTGHFSFFRLLEKFFDTSKENSVILKVNIPIILQGHKKSKITTYIKFDNVPNLLFMAKAE